MGFRPPRQHRSELGWGSGNTALPRDNILLHNACKAVSCLSGSCFLLTSFRPHHSEHSSLYKKRHHIPPTNHNVLAEVIEKHVKDNVVRGQPTWVHEGKGLFN